MEKLLILPGNEALRFNPQTPGGWPGLGCQQVQSRTLDLSRTASERGYRVVICDNQGGVPRHKTLNGLIKEFMCLFLDLPWLSDAYFCTDWSSEERGNPLGAYGYWMYRPEGRRAPEVCRFRSEDVLDGLSTIQHPPGGDDMNDFTPVYDLPPLRKPHPGLLSFAMRDYHHGEIDHSGSRLETAAIAKDSIAIWARDEDRIAAEKAGVGTILHYTKWWED